MKKMIKNFFKTSPMILLYYIVYIGVVIANIVFINLLGISVDVAKQDMKAFKTFSINILVAIVFSLVFLAISRLVRNQIQKKMNMNIKKNVGKSILGKSIGDFNNENSEYYIGTLVNDVKLMEEQFFIPMLDVICDVIYLIISCIFMFRINIVAAVIVLIGGFIPVAIPALFTSKLQKKMGTYMMENNSFLQNATDYVEGYETFTNYDETDFVKKQFEMSNKKLKNTRKSAYAFLQIMSYEISIACNAVIFVILIMGMFMALKGKMTLGQIFVLQYMAGFIIEPMSSISKGLPSILGCKDLINKINAITAVSSINTKKATFNNEIVYENGNFVIEDRAILKDVNIKFKKGKKYALVGGSGSGKSTLIKAVLGCITEATGNISYDGTDFENIDKNSIFDEITYLSQAGAMFAGTVRDNLTMFNNSRYSDNVIYEVLELVNLKDKVDELENGLNTIVDENGSNFSGGEKQRISIARALLKGKTNFVLDEVTSALDYDNYINIERLLMSIDGATVISITHRLDPKVLNAYDKIYVMDEGKLVESGKFKELIDNKGYFTELYKVQNHGVL